MVSAWLGRQERARETDDPATAQADAELVASI